MSDAEQKQIVDIGESADPTTEEIVILLKALHSENGNHRRLACSALGKLKLPYSERLLISMLDDDHPQVRQYALKALYPIVSMYAFAAARRVFSNADEKDYNKEIAHKIIAKLGGKVERTPAPSPTPKPALPVLKVHLPKNLELSADQSRVLKTLTDWIRHPNLPFITVGGYAGTGKTTITAVLRTILKQSYPHMHVAFACFTGKASQVLKQKLVDQHALYREDSVGTIHSLMYSPRIDKEGHILGWDRAEELECDLIIIDEASMVTSEMWEDIQSYGVPIIAIGDHGQLPPVGDTNSLMSSPVLTLEQIHRHAADNPILRVATMARTTGEIPFESFSPHVRKLHREDIMSQELTEGIFSGTFDDTLVLCGRNATRVRLNKHIRALQNQSSEDPAVGERVICLKNNYKHGGPPIYNGMIGILESITPHEAHWYEATIKFLGEEAGYSGKISRHQFHKDKFIEAVPGVNYKMIGDRFDFGYALTVHKAQGSQANRVVLFEERSQYWEGDLWNKWLYTAVTRAVEELYIIG